MFAQTDYAFPSSSFPYYWSSTTIHSLSLFLSATAYLSQLSMKLLFIIILNLKLFILSISQTPSFALLFIVLIQMHSSGSRSSDKGGMTAMEAITRPFIVSRDLLRYQTFQFYFSVSVFCVIYCCVVSCNCTIL